MIAQKWAATSQLEKSLEQTQQQILALQAETQAARNETSNHEENLKTIHEVIQNMETQQNNVNTKLDKLVAQIETKTTAHENQAKTKSTTPKENQTSKSGNHGEDDRGLGVKAKPSKDPEDDPEDPVTGTEDFKAKNNKIPVTYNLAIEKPPAWISEFYATWKNV